MCVTPSDRWRAQPAARRPAPSANSDCAFVLPAQKRSSALFSSRRGPIRGKPRVLTVWTFISFRRRLHVPIGGDLNCQQKLSRRPSLAFRSAAPNIKISTLLLRVLKLDPELTPLPRGNPMKFRPLHDRVVLRRLEGEEKTKGGI